MCFRGNPVTWLSGVIGRPGIQRLEELSRDERSVMHLIALNSNDPVQHSFWIGRT